MHELFADPNESDFVKAKSVAFGIFMGIVPIWGFQLIAAIALSILFRLNKTLVIIAANISIPPMIPVVIYASHWVGKWWMGNNAHDMTFTKEITLAFVHENFLQYFVGAFTLAFVAAIFFGLFTLALLKILSRRKQGSSKL